MSANNLIVIAVTTYCFEFICVFFQAVAILQISFDYFIKL